MRCTLDLEYRDDYGTVRDVRYLGDIPGHARDILGNLLEFSGALYEILGIRTHLGEDGTCKYVVELQCGYTHLTRDMMLRWLEGTNVNWRVLGEEAEVL